jgi:streptogramin lyase
MNLRRLTVLVALSGCLLGVAALIAHVSWSEAAGVRNSASCLVPTLTGKPVAAAKRAIEAHHCRVGAIRRAFSRTVAPGRVISQRPRPDARRPTGSRVALVISKGPTLPSVGTVVKQISIPNGPLGLLSLPGAVWVAPHYSDSIYRIDTASDKVVAHVVVAQGGEQPARMTFGDGTLFEANYSGEAVTLIDPSLNTVKSEFQAPFEDCCWPAYGAGSLWLMEYSSSSAANPDRFVRLDLSGHVLMSMNVSNAIGVTFGAGSVWGSSGGQVFRLDPATNQITAHVSTDAAPLAFGANSVWGVSADSRKVIRIDPATNSVSATIPLPAQAGVVTATDSAVWVAQGPLDSPGSHLWKIDPTTNRVVGQVKLPLADVLADVTVDDSGDVWVSAFNDQEVLRIHPTH